MKDSSNKELKILLVEDKAGDAALIGKMFCDFPCMELSLVNRLSAGIELLERGDIDLLLLDMDVPDGGELDMVTKITSRFPSLPVIALTSRDEEAMASAALGNGIQDYLVKGSLTPGNLNRSIRYALGRKRAEGKLAESEHRFREIAGNIPGIIFQFRVPPGRSGYFSYLSPCANDLFAYPLNLGKPGWYLGVNVPEADRAEFLASVAEAVAKRIPWTYEGRFQPPSGETKWYHVIASPTRIGEELVFDGVITNITDYKQSEATLRKGEERLRMFSQASFECLTISDSWHFIDVNDQMALMLGYEKSEIIGKPIADFIAPSSMEIVDTHVQANCLETYECDLLRKDGVVLRVEARARSFLCEGKSLRLTALRDITERKLIEEALRKSLSEKDLLMAEVHHRVKNNMQVIASLMDLQSDSIKNADARAALQDSKLRVQFMARLHQLLYQSQDIVNIKVTAFLPEIAGFVQQSYGMNNVILRERVDDLIIDIDRAISCGLIVNELASNAFKHAFSAGTGHELTLGMRRDGNEFELSVGNTGKMLSDGFDIRHSRSLGLRLVEMLTRQLCGKLAIESGEKTTFIIRFPV